MNAWELRAGGQETISNPGWASGTHIGDWLIAGLWARAVGGIGLYQGLAAAIIQASGLTLSGPRSQYLSLPWKGDGEWEWTWTAQKVLTNTGANIQFTLNAGAGAGDYYAPVFIDIPAGTVSDNEAVEIAANLSSYRSDARAGQVSLLPGEQFKADSIQVGDGPTITSGLGPPKGTASPGSIYLRRDGAHGSIFYIYEKDGWKPQF
jgi:hypothetical protein